MTQIIANGATVKIVNSDEDLNGLIGKVEGIHPAGTYRDLPDDTVYMIYVGEELFGEFGEEELEVIG